MKIRYDGEIVVGEHIKLRFEDGNCRVLVDEIDITVDCKAVDIHLAGGLHAELVLTLTPKIHGELLARQVQ